MSIQDIFLQKLKQAKYQNEGALTYFDETLDFSGFLWSLEEDRENVFKAMYGDRLIENRGTKHIKESDYRLAEALADVKNSFIPNTMFYLLTQIKIGGISV